MWGYSYRQYCDSHSHPDKNKEEEEEIKTMVFSIHDLGFFLFNLVHVNKGSLSIAVSISLVMETLSRSDCYVNVMVILRNPCVSFCKRGRKGRQLPHL